MAVVRWSPWREIERLRRIMEDAFDEFLTETTGRTKKETFELAPPMDVYDTGDRIVVKVELPGVKKEDVEVTVKGRELVIKGEKRKEEEQRDENYYCSERIYGKFVRAITLPVDVKMNEIKATFRNGVLEVELPKVEEARAREIKIEVVE
ncbi:MAG: Hsp20/alpha crystallin family protein [Thermosulfidibacteraceae bacterium]|jgi:HSP20 family protein